MAVKESTLDKYKQIIDEWFINGFNGAAAYMSQYPEYKPDSAKSGFSKLLTISNVQDYIESKQEVARNKSSVTHEHLVEDLIEIKERCMQRSPVMVKDGKRMVQAQDDEGNNLWTFDANAALKSIDILGKHVGFYEKDNSQKGVITNISINDWVEGTEKGANDMDNFKPTND